jgi:hypothetical protein
MSKGSFVAVVLFTLIVPARLICSPLVQIQSTQTVDLNEYLKIVADSAGISPMFLNTIRSVPLTDDLRSLLQATERNRILAVTAGHAVSLMKAGYELERARFETGHSTVRLVLEAQEAVLEAQSSEAEAKLTLSKTISDLRKVMRALLEK